MGGSWRRCCQIGRMEMARELGAFQRARGIGDARALLQVMLIHLSEGCGLRETAARASVVGIASVSDVALLKRLLSCGPWFEWLAQALRAAPELRDAQPDAGAPGLLGGCPLRVVDGSIVLIQLGHLKKHDARAARSWLQGKLLVALLIARLIAHAERVSPWGYEIRLLAAPPSESTVRGVKPLSCSGCRAAASRPICSLPTRLASGRLCAIEWPSLLAGGCCSGKKGRELLS